MPHPQRRRLPYALGVLLFAAAAASSCNSTALPGPVDASFNNHPDLVVACSQGIFPEFSRFCQQTADCTAEDHQTDCCGSRIITGVAVADQVNYEIAEKECRKTRPATCSCDPKPTMADDGKAAGADGRVAIACKDYVCVTFMP